MVCWRLHITPVGEAENWRDWCNDRLPPQLILRAIEGVIRIRLVTKRKNSLLIMTFQKKR